MKKSLTLFLKVLITGLTIFYSCQKEKSCEGCKVKNHPPVANAGSDTTITLACGSTASATLNGNGSTDPDNNLSSYLWTKISGPSSYTIADTNAAQTQVGNLIGGIYQFELMVKDSGGLSAKDTIQISVQSNNHPPVAKAGTDTSIVQPSTLAYLDGSGSTDADNNIVSYEWTYISGPPVWSIGNWQEVKAIATVPDVGVYQFQLKVTDACGLISRDTVMVEVKSQSNQNKLINIIFYLPEPVNTVPVDPTTGKQYWWEWWDNGSGFNGKIDFLTVKIDSLSGTIAGVWCKDCHTPTCIDFNSYAVDDPGTEHQLFKLPPGTYTWSAETIIKPFQYGYQNNPDVTQQFFDYFNTTHKTSGTITVKPGDSCIIQKIVFQ